MSDVGSPAAFLVSLFFKKFPRPLFFIGVTSAANVSLLAGSTTLVARGCVLVRGYAYRFGRRRQTSSHAIRSYTTRYAFAFAVLAFSERPCAGDIAYAISVAVNVSIGEAFAALNIYFI